MKVDPSVITLVDRSSLSTQEGDDAVYTPWTPFPANHQVAEYWIDCKTLYVGGVDLTLESSIDGDAVQIVSGPTTITAAGLTRAEITNKLAPLVRLRLIEQGSGQGGVMPISAWLLPKIGG